MNTSASLSKSCMDQEIRFSTATDGVRIAYATVGSGPPLVKAANWLSHLEFDWNSPVWRHWLKALSTHHTLVRYDERGCGLSDRDIENLTFDAFVRDLETVVEAVNLERFPLLGISQGGPVAIDYAIRHPEKVSLLILYGSYARGWAKRDYAPEEADTMEALVPLIKLGWGQNNPAYRQLFTTLFMPEATPEQQSWLNELERITTSPELAAQLHIECGNIDVVDLLPQVTVPTLVLHSREDAKIPFEEGRLIAANIPGARFVPLDSKNHILLESEPAWSRFLSEVYAFLGTKTSLSVPPSSNLRDFGTGRMNRLDILFERAVALPPGERSSFLELACADDTDLHRELIGLLEAHEEADAEAFLDAPAPWKPETPTPGSYRPDQDPLIGAKVGAYKLVQKVGHGGMGMVYKAVDERLDRLVALKFLSPHLQDRKEIKARFIQEARAASALDHANICTIYDIGETDEGQLFMAMAFYEGQTLKERIDGSPLSINESLEITLQIVEGLRRAHEAGIIHRDLKPANLALTAREEVKILDFGIAKLEGASELTKTGARLGTIAYMSPEHARGEKVDHRTDLWSVGVVLYEMLTGRRPFRGEYESAILYSILNEDPEPLRAVCPEAPHFLDQVIERLLKKDPDERYQDTEELRSHILEALSQTRSGQNDPLPIADSSIVVNSPVEAPDTWLLSSEEPVHLAGRKKECLFLQERLESVLEGHRQIVFLTGEAGIGKTTLVNAFIREAAGRANMHIWHGQCLEYRGAGEAYMPILEAIGRMCKKPGGEKLVALLEKKAPTWLVQIPWLVDAETLQDMQQRVLKATKERMLREMLEVIHTLTVRRPLILILEDIHWSDPSTVDLITWLARQPEPTRLLLIGTYRPSDVHRSNHPLLPVVQDLITRKYASELPLPFLTETEVREYLDDRFPESDLPTRLSLLVHQRTDGNALFMGNVVDAWIDQGKLAKTNGAWTLRSDVDELAADVPENLRQLIEQKIHQLSPEDQAILEAASAAGMEFSAAAVAPGVDNDEEAVEKRCDLLAKQGLFLRSHGIAEWADGTVAARYGFIHSLYQEILYCRIPAGRRARLHQKIGARLEAGYGIHAKEHAAELSTHFVQGRDARRAVTYLQFAAEQALLRNAHQEAIDHLEKGLEMLDGLQNSPERIQYELNLQASLGPAMIATRGLGAPEVEEAYLRAQALCDKLDNPPQLVPVLFGLASLYELRGEYQRTQAIIEDRQWLPEDWQGGEPLLESHELLACSLFHQGIFDKSLEHADNGLKLYDPQRHNILTVPHGENPGVNCHDWAALALWFMGYPDRALERAILAIRLSQEPGHLYSMASAQVLCSFLHQFRREDKAVLTMTEAAIKLATEQGFPYRIAQANIMKGWAISYRGQGEEGIQYIRKGLSGCDKIGVRMDRPYYYALLAEAYGAVDRIDDGLRCLDEALSMVQNSRNFFYEAEIHRLRGDLCLSAGAHDRFVEEAFEKALHVAQEQSAKSLELRTAVSLSRLWNRQGRREAARTLLADVYKGFTEGFDTPDMQEAKALLDAL